MRFSFFTTQDLSCTHGNRNSFIERRLDNRNRFIFEFFIRRKSSTKILRGETLLILLHKFDFLQEESVCSNGRFSVKKVTERMRCLKSFS
ncbi:hypothetical protein LEP1GSC043_2663 [Leptospira weilii str. Ecochallenge]|uniref:Uncharacterized protein n=2 Tax=Leptospira weilii TaxID=28184 RepID=N1U9R7_9LEPT|nr:hypothetical protein LEP1GSC108_0568 [Leptospira weilii str. UI 13098]EMY12830.1 hypothetical protein LEP1GSC043_2663 [Leptospira weilii str. Ecochallenge]